MKNQWDFPLRAICSGEFEERARSAWRRLHRPDQYAVDKVFRSEGYEWPGDFEGRALLAWTLLGRLLGETSPHLTEAMERLPGQLNARGYLGEIRPAGVIDEQQLSGHGWLLRALSEYYLDSGDRRAAGIAVNILENLVRPLAGHYRRYPFEAGERDRAGEMIGSVDRQVGDWLLSTDVGCAYILTDGVVQAAQAFGVDCGGLVDEMLECFGKIDLVGIRAQTHASLTLARGALRHYEQTGRSEALALARRIWGLYRRHGMTEHYANFNWFGRPEWTEPCAIVDSLQLALGLYRNTGDDECLDDAHRIWFSGLERAQRDNGGMGCDSCPTVEDPVLSVKIYEAFWCCTMRGAEGFWERGLRGLWRNGEGELVIALPTPGRFEFADGLSVEIATSYPLGNDWSVRVASPGAGALSGIRAYFVGTGWTSRQEGTAYRPETRPARTGTGETLWCGPVLTGTAEGGRRERLGEAWRMDEKTLADTHLTLVF